MLHEEEFFDAIDATLDLWDKEEEQVSAEKGTPENKQPIELWH